MEPYLVAEITEIVASVVEAAIAATPVPEVSGDTKSLANLFIAFFSLFLCGTTFVCGRFTKVRTEATAGEARLARMEIKIDNLHQDIHELKMDYKETIRRLHQRLDDHLRYEHNQNIPDREKGRMSPND